MLSILMPVLNEERTLAAAVERILDVDYPCEIELIVVDDGSRDGTASVLGGIRDPRVSALRHPRQRGQGAAVRTAAEAASGDHVIRCDAALTYPPEEIPRLLRPVLAGEAEVVFGSRTFGPHLSYSFWYAMANKGMTTACNVLYNAYLSDLETSFKLMPLKLFRELELRESGVGMEAELTGKLLRRGIRPYEVPINYRASDPQDGRSIGWRDGVEALWILGMTRISRPTHVAVR